MTKVGSRCSGNTKLLWLWVGQVPYLQALGWQREWARRRAEGRVPNLLLLLEHPPTITYGRGSPGPELRVPLPVLQRRGVALYPSDRGGRTTYHGPGQLVGYPICHLRELGLGPRTFLERLQGALAQVLQGWGLSATGEGPAPGLWVEGAKVASFGLRVERWVSLHGFALNLRREALEGFRWILPCGLEDIPIACVEDWREPPPEPQVAEEVAQALAATLGLQAERVGEPWVIEAEGGQGAEDVHACPLS